MNDIFVFGSFGDLSVDPSSGLVREYRADRDSKNGTEYSEIVRFDLAEYWSVYGGEQIGNIDICDIGYWTVTGAYEPPISDYRVRAGVS